MDLFYCLCKFMSWSEDKIIEKAMLLFGKRFRIKIMK